MKKSHQSSTNFEAVTPRLPVNDVERAVAFYTEKLGFNLGWKWGTPITHANVRRDSISLDLISLPADRCGTAMVYIQLRGIDSYFSELQGRQVELGDIGDRPYGMRDFEVVDPSGNRLSFGQPTVD